MTFFLQLLFEAALTVAGFFLLWFLLRARIRRFLELDNLLEGVRDESRALVIELNESADRSVSLVEDRIKSLHELLDEVDRRMGLARRELEKRAVEREVYAKLAQRRPIVPRDHEIPLQAAIREPRRTAEPEALPGSGADGPIALSLRPEPPRAAEADAEGSRGEARAGGQASSGQAPDFESPRGPERRRAPELRVADESVALGPGLREEAVGLYRKGFSADIIAARLGATVAEIELLVEIEERRSGA